LLLNATEAVYRCLLFLRGTNGGFVPNCGKHPSPTFVRSEKEAKKEGSAERQQNVSTTLLTFFLRKALLFKKKCLLFKIPAAVSSEE